MGIKCKKHLRLLVLADIPKNGNSIIDWRPFEKNTLEEILVKYNENCIETYKMEVMWSLETIENNVEIIKPMTEVDLSTVFDLRKKHFVNIHFVMIDLDAIAGKKDVLKHIKDCLPHDTPLILLQVSRTPSNTSYTAYFQPVVSTMPEIMVDQTTFEGWLNEKVCKRCRISVTARPPEWMMGDSKLLEAYLKTLPKIAANVRYAAIKRDLSEEETLALTHRASMQAIVLTRITEQVHTRTNLDVVLDAIREPVVDMPIELGFQSPALRQVNLVELHVTQPMHELTTKQRNIMFGFGIKEETETFAAVVSDQPTIWDSVGSLKGVVKATKFSAELPVGLRSMRGNL